MTIFLLLHSHDGKILPSSSADIAPSLAQANKKPL